VNVLPNNILKFEVDNVDLIYEASDNHLAIAEIWVCHAGNNLHNKPIKLENIKRASPTLLNKFLVADYEKGDFTTHTPDEQIIGFFPKENNLRYEEKDGKTYLVANAIISRIYADWAVEVFQKENKRPVSMEIEVLSTRIDEQGREEVVDFVFMGVTVLSKRTQEACVGSSATVTKFSIEEAEQFYQDYSKKEFSRYADVDFAILPKIKKNCKEGLALHKQHNNATPVALAIARFIGANNNISPDRARNINKYFMKHVDDDLDDKESSSFINFQCYGGYAARKWAKNIVDLMDTADESKMSYFSDENTGSDESENSGKEETVYMEDDEKKVEEPENKEECAMNEDEMKDKHEEEHKEETPKKEDCAVEETEEKKEEEKQGEEDKEEMSTKEGDMPMMDNHMMKDMPMMKEDMSALMSLFAGDEFEAIRGEFVAEKVDFAKVVTSLFEMLKNTKEQYSDYEELKKFKKDSDDQQFVFAVEKVLNEVSKYLPEEEISKAREDSKNHTLETLSGWANGCRAKAFEFAAKKDEKKEDKEDKKDEIHRYALVNNDVNKDKKDGSVWNRL
jgi:hypothetical protein